MTNSGHCSGELILAAAERCGPMADLIHSDVRTIHRATDPEVLCHQYFHPGWSRRLENRIGFPGSGISSADCGDGGRLDVWRSLRIALIRAALRKMSSKSEHEPTSDRSRDYGSGHPIQVCRDIGRTFSWLPTSPINV